MEPIEKQASGIMVCLYLPSGIAEELAVDGGEPAEDLHVTLVYVPKLGEDEIAFKVLCRLVCQVAERYAPVLGRVGGIGVFNASDASDGKDVYYATFNAPILPALVQDLMSTLDWAGVDFSRQHGFVPHITLKYLDESDGGVERKESGPFRVPFISVASRTFREDIPFTGLRISKSQPSGGSVHVPTTEEKREKQRKQDDKQDEEDTGADPAAAAHPVAAPSIQTPGWQGPPEDNLDVAYSPKYKGAPRARRPKRAPADNSVAKSVDELLAVAAIEACLTRDDSRDVVKIAKLNQMKQICYGVVLEPGTVDLQGDVMDAESIEETAHKYLEDARKVGRRHQSQIRAVPVESYLAPQDLIFDGIYGQTEVKKGSWILGVKVHDPAEWAKVENGEYTGFSVGGVGVRDDL